MRSANKYLYCLIKCPDERDFAVDAIGGAGSRVYTVNYLDLAAVVSDSGTVTDYRINKENASRHEAVIETVLKEFTVLPVGFGCVTEGADQLREKVLKRHFEEPEELLNQMDGKVEMALKAIWKDKGIICEQILKSDPRIQGRLNKIMAAGKMDLSQVIVSSTEVGSRLISTIEKIKERQTRILLETLEKRAVDKTLKKVYSPLMIFNAAFLVNRAREEEFDKAVGELDERYGSDIKFIYTGPLAPYSFVNLRIALQ